MNPKRPSSDRGFGQLSLLKSFPFKPLSGDFNEEEGQIKPSKKNPSISLSEFLNRKLIKNSSPSKIIQSKKKPFLGIEGKAGSVVEQIEKKRGTSEPDALLDESVFKLFNHPRREREESGEIGGGGDLGGSTKKPDGLDFRKQSYPFRVSSEGGDKRDATPKHLVVLGDDPKPKQKKRETKFIRNKKPRTLFNHYASGGGWWDCDMEGVDNEEVGSNEAWEGMGSTTLGGLEWH